MDYDQFIVADVFKHWINLPGFQSRVAQVDFIEHYPEMACTQKAILYMKPRCENQ